MSNKKEIEKLRQEALQHAPVDPSLLMLMQGIIYQVEEVCEEVGYEVSDMREWQSYEKGDKLIAVTHDGDPVFYRTSDNPDLSPTVYTVYYCDLMHFVTFDRDVFKKRLVNLRLAKLARIKFMTKGATEALTSFVEEHKEYISEYSLKQWGDVL